MIWSTRHTDVLLEFEIESPTLCFNEVVSKWRSGRTDKPVMFNNFMNIVLLTKEYFYVLHSYYNQNLKF